MEPDDTSSNPHADGHLPASGEFDANNVPSGDNPLTTADAEDDEPEGIEETPPAGSSPSEAEEDHTAGTLESL